MKSVIRTLAFAFTAALAACGDPPPAATSAPLESTPPVGAIGTRGWNGALATTTESAHVGSPTTRAASNPMPGSDPRTDPAASNPMPGTDPWEDPSPAEDNAADGTGASNPMPGSDPSQGPSASNPMPGQGPK